MNTDPILFLLCPFLSVHQPTIPSMLVLDCHDRLQIKRSTNYMDQIFSSSGAAYIRNEKTRKVSDLQAVKFADPIMKRRSEDGRRGGNGDLQKQWP
ncbi:hypothetical protein SLA2020_383280 [Shorea laevis]